MHLNFASWLWQKIIHFLVSEYTADDQPLYDYPRLAEQIRPGDVILVEGRSHVSDVIKVITQSPWTHSALYIGKINDIKSPFLRKKIYQNYTGNPHQALIIEALLGEGTVVYPLQKYASDHIRICRPMGLSVKDTQRVIQYAINRLGEDYDVRQLIDLARFFCPWSFLPRRWRSTLFQHHAGKPTRTVCSTMLSEAFHSVHYPVLPIVQYDDQGNPSLYQRNPRLLTPKDFDYSPYFTIIKYPLFSTDDVMLYRHLPWNKEGKLCNTTGDCYLPGYMPKKQTFAFLSRIGVNHE